MSNQKKHGTAGAAKSQKGGKRLAKPEASPAARSAQAMAERLEPQQEPQPSYRYVL